MQQINHDFLFSGLSITSGFLNNKSPEKNLCRLLEWDYFKAGCKTNSQSTESKTVHTK